MSYKKRVAIFITVIIISVGMLVTAFMWQMDASKKEGEGGAEWITNEFIEGINTQER
ncbi:MAG: hypothetical protein WDZ39_00160 [Candidatus Spechtbacterales bacterium]